VEVLLKRAESGRFVEEVRGIGLTDATSGKVGLVLTTVSAPGVLHQLTGVIVRHAADIRSVSIIEDQPTGTRIYFELDVPGPVDPLTQDLEGLEVVREVTRVQSLAEDLWQTHHYYGRRRASRTSRVGSDFGSRPAHIRGEHISVDTIPLVGEATLAAAVRACRRLARVRALVLAGSIMGGEIELAVREVRAEGLLVISLNMAGVCPTHAIWWLRIPCRPA